VGSTTKAREVSVSPYGNYVFVTAAGSDSVAVVDVTTKTAPAVRGGVKSVTYVDDARGMAVSPDGCFLFLSAA
jgi:DNA-binding beta-propeller fold protein YncE